MYLLINGIIRRAADMAIVPPDAGNADYLDYLDYLSDGGQVGEIAELPAVTSVTPRQARLALLNLGLLDQVETAMLAFPAAARIEWEFAGDVRRDSELVAAMSNHLSLDDGEIDRLFCDAALL